MTNAHILCPHGSGCSCCCRHPRDGREQGSPGDAGKWEPGTFIQGHTQHTHTLSLTARRSLVINLLKLTCLPITLNLALQREQCGYFFLLPFKKCYIEKRSIKLCKIPSINKPVSSIASMSITCPSPDLTWERQGTRLGSLRDPPREERGRLPPPSVLSRNHAGAEVLGAWLAGLASSGTG